MTTTQTATAGREFAATILRNFHIGPRTRRYRDGMDLHAEIAETIEHAVYLPGYHSEATTAAYSPAFAAVAGYRKHVQGYRVRPETCAKVAAMTPRQFVLMLAAMVDAGVSNQGEAETYFQGMA
jgi:hypothetical protein